MAVIEVRRSYAGLCGTSPLKTMFVRCSYDVRAAPCATASVGRWGLRLTWGHGIVRLRFSRRTDLFLLTGIRDSTVSAPTAFLSRLSGRISHADAFFVRSSPKQGSSMRSSSPEAERGRMAPSRRHQASNACRRKCSSMEFKFPASLQTFKPYPHPNCLWSSCWPEACRRVDLALWT